MLLALHVAAGSLALLLALPLVAGWLSWNGRAGSCYSGLVLLVGTTALALVGPGSTLPTSVRALLLLVALATCAAAGLGLRRRHARSLRLLRGSVVSLVTAVAVVSGPTPLWLATALVGTAWVELAHRRAVAPARALPR